jgi:hypothetical protein
MNKFLIVSLLLPFSLVAEVSSAAHCVPTPQTFSGGFSSKPFELYRSLRLSGAHVSASGSVITYGPLHQASYFRMLKTPDHVDWGSCNFDSSGLDVYLATLFSGDI